MIEAMSFSMVRRRSLSVTMARSAVVGLSVVGVRGISLRHEALTGGVAANGRSTGVLDAGTRGTASSLLHDPC